MSLKILSRFQDIPKVRDGKAEIEVINAYRRDCETYGKMCQSYLMDRGLEKVLLKEWDEFIEMRKAENFCPWSKSANRNHYMSILGWIR